MNAVAWVLTGLLSLAFSAAGAGKLTQKYEHLATTDRMRWVEDFTPTQIGLIGALELAGVAGLILPWALNIARWLTPTAAGCLAATMIGAALVHRRRRERPQLVVNGVLFVIAVSLAALRLWQLA